MNNPCLTSKIAYQWRKRRKLYRTVARYYTGSIHHSCIGWVVGPMYPGIPDTARSWLLIGVI